MYILKKYIFQTRKNRKSKFSTITSAKILSQISGDIFIVVFENIKISTHFYI